MDASAGFALRAAFEPRCGVLGAEAEPPADMQVPSAPWTAVIEVRQRRRLKLWLGARRILDFSGATGLGTLGAMGAFACAMSCEFDRRILESGLGAGGVGASPASTSERASTSRAADGELIRDCLDDEGLSPDAGGARRIAREAAADVAGPACAAG